jgi:hypothetical protein
MASEKLPSRNVILILIFGVGVILFVLLSIFPSYSDYNDITQQIDSLKAKIEEQKILSPIFNDFSAKTKFEEPDNLPFPAKSKMPKKETGKISSTIQGIIQNNGFQLDKIETDVDSLLQESGFLKLSVHMSGDFLNLRNVMLELGGLSYLEHVESIEISRHNENSKIQLKLWFAQQ